MDGEIGRSKDSGDPAVVMTRTNASTPFQSSGLSHWALIGFYAATLIAGAILLAITPYARKVDVSGFVKPGSGYMEVASPRAGTVASVYVREGQDVGAGAPLALISVDTMTIEGPAIGTMLAQANARRARSANLQKEADRERLAQQRNDIAARLQAATEQASLLTQLHSLALQSTKSAEDQVERVRPVVEKGFISLVQLQQRIDIATMSRAHMLDIEQQQSDIKRTLTQLAIERRQLDAKATENAASAATAEAGVIEGKASSSQQQMFVVVAPRAGRVAVLRAFPGSQLTSGSQIATVVPIKGALEVEFGLPSRAIGFVRPGDTVRVMYDAFPFQSFGFGHGKVRSVSNAPLVDPSSHQTTADPTYPVRVTLDRPFVTAYGRDWPLVPGMAVHGSVQLHRGSALEWLLEPLLAARARAIG